MQNHINFNSTRSVVRTLGTEEFEDEKPRPLTGNLTSHTKEHHQNKLDDNMSSQDGDTVSPEATSALIDHGFTVASAQIMADMLKEGKLNPKIEPSRAGFLRVFAAWILDDDLPFTTGETLSIKRLFDYLHIKFQLPSDTTVRNTLAKIFITLHGTVVEELSVSYLNS